MDEKNILKKLVDSVSKDKKILGAITKMSNAASIKSKNVVSNTSSRAVSSLGRFFPKFLLSLLIIFIGTIFGSNFIWIFYDFLLNFLGLAQNFIGELGVYWGANFILFYLFILIITYILADPTSDIISREIKWFFIIGFIIIVLSLIITSDFATLYSNSDKLNIVQKESSSKWSLFVEKITCIGNPSCIQADLKKNEAKTSKISDYSLYFNKNSVSNLEYTPSDLKIPLILDYKIRSSGDLVLNKIDCYLNDRNSKPFYSEQKNQLIKTGLVSRYMDDFKCDKVYDAILKDKSKINKSDYTIIVVLDFSFETLYTQSIPIIDYTNFIESENLNPSNTYSYNFLKEKLDKKTNGKKSFIQSNDALIVDDNIIVDKLPLLFGDLNDSLISFPLTISVNSANDFGKFISGEILDIKLPSSLKFSDDKNNYKKEINVVNNKFSQRINLVENDAGLDTSSQILTKQSLDIKIKSNFEKENRFRIKVVDFNVSKFSDSNILINNSNNS